MPKIPYGVSNFEKLRKKDYLYVDKTKYIEILESYGEPYIFFLRPRRFGKTLFLSTLEHYYDLNKEADFEELFGELYIGKNKTELANSYYILKFDFSGLDTKDKELLRQDYLRSTLEVFKNFADKYNLDLDYTKSGSPAAIFNSFLTAVQSKIEGKIYVLIDEYDHFANELLSFQVDTFEETISKTGFVRKWYEVLKQGTASGVVDRIFATGVSPITLDSLTSGFNIAKNKSRDRNLNQMIGFTEEEVKFLLNKVLGVQNGANEELFLRLKRYYNGYLFHEKAEQRVFNSDMILYYLSEYQIADSEPDDLIDTNISSDYSKLSALFSLKNKERNYQILESILEGELQEAVITREFSLAKEFIAEDFLSLLFYLGFLTIDSSVLNLLRLKVPNYVIKELYFDFFAKLLRDETDYEIESIEIKKSIISIALEGQIDKFIELIERTLSKLSSRDYINFDEKYIKLIMLSYLFLSRVYYVKSEYEVEDGYIDIALLERSGVKPEYEAIIELKYLKKSEYQHRGKAAVASKLAAGKEQILKYQQAEELREKENLEKWVLVFVGEECVEVQRIKDR
ncbi:AAA family ATPase [Fuchsiella alkaliacetigena]|uniref:AAA family ATPase n=1 Tax=Fuchsiella alkaliacetigena TaxID=957042 RepID=UPI00200B818D|nr:AAA family ATPase [Fuchsiella alkaliacetigena]MCK8824875.1 ATP-binding protein [Fuchsiella alkaliacetigena]